MSIKLKKFDMSAIGDHQIIVFIGKRGTGKSFLVKDFLFHRQDIPVGTVVSPTEKMNKYFSKFIPPIFIHEEYTPRLVTNVLKRQGDIIKKINSGEYGEDVDPRAFLIFDDCLFDNIAFCLSVSFLGGGLGVSNKMESLSCFAVLPYTGRKSLFVFPQFVGGVGLGAIIC